MADKINVTFVHPTTSETMEVEIDENLSSSAAINELIACNFIPDNSHLGGYELLIKDTQQRITGTQTVASGGAKDGGTIRVIPITDGGNKRKEM